MLLRCLMLLSMVFYSSSLLADAFDEKFNEFIKGNPLIFECTPYDSVGFASQVENGKSLWKTQRFTFDATFLIFGSKNNTNRWVVATKENGVIKYFMPISGDRAAPEGMQGEKVFRLSMKREDGQREFVASKMDSSWVASARWISHGMCRKPENKQ